MPYTSSLNAPVCRPAIIPNKSRCLPKYNSNHNSNNKHNLNKHKSDNDNDDDNNYEEKLTIESSEKKPPPRFDAEFEVMPMLSDE